MASEHSSKRSVPATAQYPVGFIFLLAVVCFLLGAGIAYFSSHAKGPPERASLATATGKVAWSSSEKYSVRFAFVDDKRQFSYASKSNGLGVVEAALARPDHPQVSVLYDPADLVEPVLSSQKYFSVYELRIGADPVRSYEEVNAAWIADNRIGVWLGGAFLVAGLMMVALGIQQSKARAAARG